ncbi:MAG TPA: hypothetical protein VGA16_01465 [Candidatus Limnocylindria bacterium]
MATTAMPARQRTLRRDLWWIEPALIFILFTVFVLYSVYAGLANANYYSDPYLSPFYSPCITANCAHLTLGVPIIGAWWNLAPAIWIVGFPLTFRLTCYYYRKAYYRAFFWSPAACTVPDARAKYSGETKVPFIWQNIHRYSWYPAVLLVFILSYDAILAFRFPTASGGHAFGIGLGTVLMVVNVVLIALYTFSCHFCRYLVGGRLDRFWGRPLSLRLWRLVSLLNVRHGIYALTSLVSIGVTELYIRLLAMGVLSDPRIVFGG